MVDIGGEVDLRPPGHRLLEVDLLRPVDELEEIDSEDLSDFDIDDIAGSSGVIEEIEDLEEISEDDLIPDDDSKKKK